MSNAWAVTCSQGARAFPAPALLPALLISKHFAPPRRSRRLKVAPVAHTRPGTAQKLRPRLPRRSSGASAPVTPARSASRTHQERVDRIRDARKEMQV